MVDDLLPLSSHEVVVVVLHDLHLLGHDSDLVVELLDLLHVFSFLEIEL